MKTVKKMLSPEEMTILENIQSLLGQLASTGAVEEETAMEEPDPDPDLIQEALKRLGTEGEDDSVEKEENGANGSDSADERLEDNTDISEDNMSEVGKALLQLVKKSMKTKEVKKSNQTTEILNGITQVLKSMQEQQAEQSKALSNIFDALDFSDDVIKNNTIEKSQKKKPVHNVDAREIVREMFEVMKSQNQGNSTPVQANDFNNVNKHEKLSQALPHIFRDNLK